jgi:acetyltransferase-like isoleucine patch superfamily enzyme
MPSSILCETHRLVRAPRLGTNDDVVRVLKWLVGEGERVEVTTAIVSVETTKANVEVEAESVGYIFPLVEADAEIAVGAPIAIVADTPVRPDVSMDPAGSGSSRTPHETLEPVASGSSRTSSQVITRKAQELIDEHGIALDAFTALAVVRTTDVEHYLASRANTAATPATPAISAEQEAEWQAMLASPQYRDLQSMLSTLREQMRARFGRHVPLGTLLGDRWQLAQAWGFGEGTSVYDECLIQGDVRVGRHVWIGPYTVLDGKNAPLVIGDNVDIGSGAHLYTHNAMESTLTGRRAPIVTAPVTIGNCCFIAPMASIGPGTTIGDHSFVAAGSFVEGTFKPFSYIAGSPARRVGTVEIIGDRVRIRRMPQRDE